MPASHMEVGCQVARAPQKPALPATSRNQPLAKSKASGLTQTGDGGSWPESHGPQRAKPEAPNPSKRKPANPIPVPLIDWKAS